MTSTLPNTNFGGQSNLAINSSSAALLRFDLSNLPALNPLGCVARNVLRTP